MVEEVVSNPETQESAQASTATNSVQGAGALQDLTG